MIFERSVNHKYHHHTSSLKGRNSELSLGLLYVSPYLKPTLRLIEIQKINDLNLSVGHQRAISQNVENKSRAKIAL